MKKLMHYNQNLPHQVDHARAFEACGFEITTNPGKAADIHVISGPNYAMRWWMPVCEKSVRTLMIDRAWWDDPSSVSIGWLQEDGTRKFASGTAERAKPEMMPWKTRECSCLVMADYGQNISEVEYLASQRFTTVAKRLHPADSKVRHLTTLETDLTLRDVAITTSGTSGVTAITMGVPTICLDPKNECSPVCSDSIDAPLYRGDREQWLHEMSYKQFTLAEIADGTAWNLLKDIQ